MESAPESRGRTHLAESANSIVVSGAPDIEGAGPAVFRLRILESRGDTQASSSGIMAAFRTGNVSPAEHCAHCMDARLGGGLRPCLSGRQPVFQHGSRPAKRLASVAYAADHLRRISLFLRT